MEEMSANRELELGLQAFERRAWSDAYEHLRAADRSSALAPAHLERLATAAYLAGHGHESRETWARAHQAFVDVDDVLGAVRCAFWLTIDLTLDGEVAQASGWVARAGRLVEEEADPLARTLVVLLRAVRSYFEGDAAGAFQLYSQAAELGRRSGNADVEALVRLGQGQTLITLERPRDGVPLLDEAMIAVTTDQVSPILAGIVYCAVIETCQDVFDLRRAGEWTAALSRWCDVQPDLVPFRGQCMVHRAEVLQFRGAWEDAVEQTQRACDRFADPPGQPALGLALYRRGELHRLRGEYATAERDYRSASEHGHAPQPGLALLRLAQGDTETAATAVRHALDDSHDRSTRARLLAAAVEIELAADDVGRAQKAAAELLKLAATLDAPVLDAIAQAAAGAVRLAEGDAGGARGPLRRSWKVFHELDAPYEAARVRMLLGLACRSLGDDDGAEMEFDAARVVFEQLGAVPEAARASRLSGRNAKRTAGLTERECEVLRLVAAGKTNRGVAEDLIISEKTVARHVSNIFVKLGVPSRSAATAYAYEHDLV
jgi:DNA-binding CsgD family transcriptional regulator